MKIWTTEHIFEHPWETVTLAAWRKYPNPHKPEIMGSDILERDVHGGVMQSSRLIASRFGLPGWSRKLLGSDDICYGYEKSQVDPRQQIMSTQTRNITFSRVVTMGERIEYRACEPSPDGAPRTMLVQESTVQVHGIPLANYLENTILSSVMKNNLKGLIAMDWIINKITTEEPTVSSNLLTSTDINNINNNRHSSMEGTITHAIVTEMSDQAKKSVDELSVKAIKSVDELSEKAMKSVDEISEKALKSVDGITQISEKALKSVDVISEKALKSVDEISEKALKSVDEINEKAKISYILSERALRSYRIFDDLFNICL